jgi:hypothetical protein
MPRHYDDYLYSSLCGSGDERANTDSSNQVNVNRRKSISDGLAPIPIVVEGNGVSVKMRVKPHVRWTKVLAKWTAAFEGDAPMAWPVLVRIPSRESSMACNSIQESISRTLGPELLAEVSDNDPALIVLVGNKLGVTEDSNYDVVPPVVPNLPVSVSDVPLKVVTQENGDPAPVPPEPVAPEPAVILPTESDLKRTYKIRIESNVFKKPIKMSVSGGCTVSRLIRKYLEALKQSDVINPKTVRLSYEGKPLVDLTMSQILQNITENVLMEAFVVNERSLETTPTPKRQRRKSSSDNKRSTSSKTSKLEDETEQQAQQLAYWEQVHSVRKNIQASEDDEEDEDLALALALSLSTEIK